MFNRQYVDKEECELKRATETLKRLANDLRITTNKLAEQVAILKSEGEREDARR